MRNSRGAALVFLLSCLPFLLSLAALAGAIGLGMAAHATNLFTCRFQLMQAQQDFADPLNHLLDMNNRANVLHQQYLAAKANALANPGNPAAQLQLQLQIAKNSAFHRQQETLLQQAQSRPEQRLRQLPEIMAQSLASELPFQFGKALDVQVPDAQVSVVPVELDEMTWRYETSPDFSQSQELTAKWDFHTEQILPKWIQKYLTDIPDIQGECSATVEKGGAQWSPILGTGKS